MKVGRYRYQWELKVSLHYALGNQLHARDALFFVPDADY